MDSRYEDALERCKKEFNFNNLAYSHEEIRQRLERVFPELRESEDEIFKELLYNLITSNDCTPSSKEIFSIYGKTKEDCLAWLEKRSEQSIVTDVLIKAGLKPYKDGDKWCVLVGDNIQDGICGFGDTIDEALFEFLKELTEMSKKSQGKSPLELWKDMRLEVYQQASGNRHEPNCSDDSTKMFSLTDIDEIFEKIVEKQDEQKPTGKPKFKVGDWVMLDRPVLITKVEDMPYNTHQYWTSDGKWFGDATKAKLWTIQDAKDGDVLATDSGRPFIFKGCLDEKHPNSPVSYCGIDSTNYFYNYKGSVWWTDENVYPATKEQRDLLFQKMREAGYEWDAENKRLLTIEPVSYNNMDDLIADAMIAEINESNLPESSKHNRIFWIKSHRQKRDWSAEDERTLEAVIKEIEANKAACPEYDEKAYDMFLSWLKSIKPNHWKPSNEQMDALDKAKNSPANYYDINLGLQSLYDDLQKL